MDADQWLGLGLGTLAFLVAIAAFIWVRIALAGRRHAEVTAKREAEIARIVEVWEKGNAETLSPGDRAVHSLAASWALWPRVPGQAAAAIRAAADALAFDVDSPSLRELAGLSEHYRDQDEVRDLLADTLDELGVAAVSPESDEGQILALRHYCLEWRDGRLSDVGLAEWACNVIGHEGPLIAQEVVELEDDFLGVAHHQQVKGAVRRFLDLTAGLTPIAPERG